MSNITEKYGITPGPWESAYYGTTPHGMIRGDDGRTVVAIITNANEEEANARAIAEVPAMIEELEIARAVFVESAMQLKHGLRDKAALECSRQIDRIDAILKRIKVNS